MLGRLMGAIRRANDGTVVRPPEIGGRRCPDCASTTSGFDGQWRSVAATHGHIVAVVEWRCAACGCQSVHLWADGVEVDVPRHV